jgi:hypothetical protein
VISAARAFDRKAAPSPARAGEAEAIAASAHDPGEVAHKFGLLVERDDQPSADAASAAV